MDTMIYVFELLALIIGSFSCFAGYRVLKSIAPICCFAVGCAIGVIVSVKFEMIIGIALMVVLGLLLAVLSFKLFRAGVFSVVAFLTAIATYIVCRNILACVVAGVIIGFVAIFLVKHVSIVITAVSGALIVIWSALMLVSIEDLKQVVIWLALWLVIAAAGIVCQYLTSRSGSDEFYEDFSDEEASINDIEGKYPGMQIAYRNYCIKCGYEMDKPNSVCQRCGFDFDE